MMRADPNLIYTVEALGRLWPVTNRMDMIHEH